MTCCARVTTAVVWWSELRVCKRAELRNLAWLFMTGMVFDGIRAMP